MELTIETIDALSRIMAREKLTSLSLDQGHLKIELKREHCHNLPIESNLRESPTAGLPEKTSPTPNSSIVEILSPMVGVFYESSKPGEKPFVAVGESFLEGDTLCIIEAMKLMNELVAEFPGKIVEVCVKNGDVVEYEQVLFRIDQGVKDES